MIIRLGFGLCLILDLGMHVKKSKYVIVFIFACSVALGYHKNFSLSRFCVLQLFHLQSTVTLLQLF